MHSNCSSIGVDEFDDLNERSVYSDSINSTSLTNNHLTLADDFYEQIIKKEDFESDQKCENKTITYDPQLGNVIFNELGLNDSQTSRKNAWGNLSYSELICKAILNSHQQRLTLSQIYSWIILYVPYFKDKSDRKSSQGWKVFHLFYFYYLSFTFRILFVIIYHYIIVLFEFQMK
jgi:hypothetical protein